MNKKIELQRLDKILDLAQSRGYEVIGLLCSNDKQGSFYPSDELVRKFNNDNAGLENHVQKALEGYLSKETTEIKVID